MSSSGGCWTESTGLGTALDISINTEGAGDRNVLEFDAVASLGLLTEDGFDLDPSSLLLSLDMVSVSWNS